MVGLPDWESLAWNSRGKAEPRTVLDGRAPSLWVVDGQQRITALSILCRRKPYWWSEGEEWNKTLTKYDIRFDVEARETPYFWVADAVVRRAKTNKYVPLKQLLVLDTDRDDEQRKMEELARDIKLQGLCDGMDAMEVYTRLDRVRKIRDKDIVIVSIDHELEDVVEVFARLNSRGTRVTEADIYLGIVAARTPGWVRSTFLPYLANMEEAGFDISPNLLFRSLTGVGAKRVRFKEIPDDFWNETNVKPAWQRTEGRVGTANRPV